MVKLAIALTLLIASALPGSALVTMRSFETGEKIALDGNEALDALFNGPNRVYATETSGFEQTYTTAYYKGSAKELKEIISTVSLLPYEDKFVDLSDKKVGVINTNNCDSSTIEYDWSISASRSWRRSDSQGRDYSIVLAVYDAANRLKRVTLPTNLTPIVKDTKPARETKKGIVIYRLQDKTVTGRDMDRKDFYTVKLDTEPVIYPDEIILLDTTQRRVQVKPEALNRLPKPGVHGIPLVVCGDDKRLFVLGLWSVMSSYAPSFPTTTWEMIDRNKNTLTFDLTMPIKNDETEIPNAYQEFFDILRREGKLVEKPQN